MHIKPYFQHKFWRCALRVHFYVFAILDYVKVECATLSCTASRLPVSGLQSYKKNTFLRISDLVQYILLILNVGITVKKNHFDDS